MALGLLEIILITTSVLEFNPLFQSLKIIRLKEAKDVSVFTYLMIFTVGALWLTYGFQINNLPLIIGNTIKLVASSSVIIVYFRYRPKRRAKAK